MGAFKYTKASCGLALAICTLLISESSSYSYTMEQMCAQWWDSGYIGNPSSCKAWGYCQGQKLVSWGTCGTGMVFNAQTGSCASASKTVCSTSVVDTCKAAGSPTYVSNPNNCTEYAYCYGNGTYGMGACPQGQMYLASDTSCTYASTCPQDTICRFMKSDIFVGDPNNCGQFLQCLNGAAKPGVCSSATYPYYNVATGRCEKTNTCTNTPDSGTGTTYPANVTACGAFVESTSTDATTDASTDSTTEGTGTTADDVKSQFFADGKTCYGYYACQSKTGSGQWGSCPKGTHFNPTSQKCVSPAAYSCPLNRCGNLNLKYVTQAKSSCKNYINCSTGVVGTCPTGYLYFNEVSGDCETADPDYPICTAS